MMLANFTNRVFPLMAIVLAIATCKHAPPIEESIDNHEVQPYEADVTYFRFIPRTGNLEKDCCDLHIMVNDTNDSKNDGMYFPIAIPTGIDTSGRTYYTGKLKIFPGKTVQCRNCRVDPMPPNRLPAIDTFQKVEILEFEER